MKPRVRETIKIARMIVVQMRQDYVRDPVGIEPQKRQGVGGIAQQIATAPSRGFLCETGIDEICAIAPTQDPDEVTEIGSSLVRIGKNEDLA